MYLIIIWALYKYIRKELKIICNVKVCIILIITHCSNASAYYP